MRFLFVIEAPGKLNRYAAIARVCGLPDAVFVATSGHFFNHADGLSNIGIDANLIEYGRRPAAGIADRLIVAARDADAIYIATDPDSEGDAIAWDVASILRPEFQGPILRMRMGALTPRAFAAGISQAKQVDIADAAPARARGLLDRMIGATFSEGLPAGRVFSALLGSLASDPAPIAEYVFRLPARDGGREFTGIAALKSNEIEAAKRAFSLFPADLAPEGAPIPKPKEAGNFADLLRAALRLPNTDAQSVSGTCQKLYEAGRISYFRTSGKNLGRDALDSVAILARRHGMKTAIVQTMCERPADGHEAHHLQLETGLARDPRGLPLADAIPALIGRLSLGAVAHEAVQYAAADDVPEEALWLFRRARPRRMLGALRPGIEPETRSAGLHLLTPDTMIFERLAKIGLGRPSTWTAHITKAKERNILAADGGLTPHAREWARRTSPGLLDPKFAHEIEAICELALDTVKDSEMPWRPVAAAAFARLPKPERLRIVEKIEAAANTGAAGMSCGNGAGAHSRKAAASAAF